MLSCYRVTYYASGLSWLSVRASLRASYRVPKTNLVQVYIMKMNIEKGNVG